MTKAVECYLIKHLTIPVLFFFKQLVYKVKANTLLEKLAAASLGSYCQEALLDLGNEAKENLQKIQVGFYF